MSEMKCWCCEHFILYENVEIIDGKLTNGKCIYKNVLRYANNTVCEDFIVRKGLYSKRTIPSHCKNYR